MKPGQAWLGRGPAVQVTLYGCRVCSLPLCVKDGPLASSKDPPVLLVLDRGMVAGKTVRPAC